MAELIDETTDQVHGVVGSRGDGEDQSKVCEPCKVDNDIQPAVGWCETCDEMLCSDCYKIHCRQKMMKDHQLWSITEVESRRQVNKLPNTCERHEREALKYFCEDHTELGCNQCFVSKHRQCSEVVCISEIATSESNEFKALQLLLSKLEERLNAVEIENEKNESTTGRQHDEAILCIQEAGEKMKALIDSLVKEEIARAEMSKEDNIRNIGQVGGLKNEIEEGLTAARDMLNAVKGNNNQLFITMKHLQREAKMLESKLCDTEQNNLVREYEFVLNPELARLLDTVTGLGTLKDTRELNMLKATEFVNEFDIQRFERVHFGQWYCYDGKRSEIIKISTDRDIRLLFVLLYPCKSGDTNVKLRIKEGRQCLISNTSTHANTGEDIVAVKVVGDGGIHGITLQAGHRYDVVVTITGGYSTWGKNGVAKVMALGVNFTFSGPYPSSYTTVVEGQIPGFRFALL